MKRTMIFIGTFAMIGVLVLSLFAIGPAKAANPIVNVTAWPVDVHNPDLTFTDPPVAMTVASGNPSWISGFSVTGSSATADFTMQYQKTVSGEIVEKVLTEEGVPAHCPPGYIKGLDSSRPNDCAQLATPGADAYYVYEGEVETSPATLGTCASLGDGWEDNPATTGSSDACRKIKVPAHQECEKGCLPVVFSDSRQVSNHDAHWGPWESEKCPSGSGNSCQDEKHDNQWRHHHWIGDTYTTEFWPTNGSTVNIPYDKSCDKNKCHRPSDDDLRDLFPGIPSWVRHDITSNHLNDGANPGITPEWMDQVDVNCHTVPATYDYQPKPAIPAEYGCDEANGWQDNPGGEGDKACSKLIPSVDATYIYKDEVLATTDIYSCPDGTTETTDGKCQYPDGTLDSYVEFLLNLPSNPGPLPTPVCDPHGGCTGSAPIWENIMGPIQTGPSLYGNGHQSMDVTWTGADICEWNPTIQQCESRLPFVVIKVRAPQPSFTLYLNGAWLKPETVNAVDGSVWYVFRAQISSNTVMPAFAGVNVLNDGHFWIMDETQKMHWWEATGVIPWTYPDCSDAPDFGDTRLNAGIAEMGRFPGMVTEDVQHFLVLNGVANAEAHDWAFNTWHALKFGEYAALPASFVPVKP